MAKTFEQFHFSLIERDEPDFLEPTLTREAWLRSKLGSQFQFRHMGKAFHWVPQPISDEFLVGVVERQKSQTQRTPPDEGALEIEAEIWKGSMVVIDPVHRPDGQKVAFENDSSVGQPKAVLTSLVAHLNTNAEGFVNLDVRAGPANRNVTVNFRHVFADQLRHAPSGFVGHAKLALQFLAAHAVAGDREQVDCIEPELKRGPRLFERGAHGRVQVVTAELAGIGALRLDPEPLGFALTLGALEALAEANFEQVIEAGFVVRKETEKLGGRKGLLAHSPLYSRPIYVWQGDRPPLLRRLKEREKNSGKLITFGEI